MKASAHSRSNERSKYSSKLYLILKIVNLKLFSFAGKKLTVLEARKKFKSKEQILKENLKKIELIRKTNKVNLEKDIVNQVSFFSSYIKVLMIVNWISHILHQPVIGCSLKT